MVVDDSESVCTSSKATILTSAFAEKVITYTEAKEAIKYFSQYFERKKKGDAVELPPSLIFVDLVMPGFSGWDFVEDFLRKYSERLPETKIVIITSSIDPEDFIRYSKYQGLVLDFIYKPMGDEQIEDLKQHEVLAHSFAQ